MREKKTILDITIPSFDFDCEKGLTEESLIEISMMIDDIQDVFDNSDDIIEDDPDEEFIKEQSLQERLHVDKNYPDGTPKPKQVLADERWEKRQQVLRETEAEIAEFVLEAKNTMLKLTMQISRLTQVTLKLLDINTYLSLVMQCLDVAKKKLSGSPYFRYIDLKIRRFALKIKRFLIVIKKQLRDAELQLLTMIYEGKCIAALETAYSYIMVPIAALKVALDRIMDGIQKVINFLPDMIIVGPEAMSFL